MAVTTRKIIRWHLKNHAFLSHGKMLTLLEKIEYGYKNTQGVDPFLEEPKTYSELDLELRKMYRSYQLYDWLICPRKLSEIITFTCEDFREVTVFK